MSIVNEKAAPQAETALNSLNSRVTRLLFAPTRDDERVSAESLTDVARQISAWVADARQILTQTAPAPPAADADAKANRNAAAVGAAGLRQESAAVALEENVTRRASQLAYVVDRLIQDPCPPDAMLALELTLAKAQKTLSDARTALSSQGRETNEQSQGLDPFPTTRRITPWITSPNLAEDRISDRTSTETQGQSPPATAREIPAGTKPRVEIQRLDATERAWWESQFLRVQRRADSAWMLGLAILTGLGGLVFWEGTRNQPGLAGVVPDRMLGAPDLRPPAPGFADTGQTSSTAARFERRMAEMEVEIVRLRAELEVALRAGLDKAATATETNEPGIEDDDPEAASGSKNPTPQKQVESADTLVPPTEVASIDVVIAAISMITPRPLDPSLDASLLAAASLIRQQSDENPTHQLQPVVLGEPAYAVQLSSLQNAAKLRRFLDTAPVPPSHLFVESTKTFDLVFIGFFKDAESARQALAALPDSLRRARPWVRRLDANQIFYQRITE